MTRSYYYAMNILHLQANMTFLPSKNKIYKSSNKNNSKNPSKTGTTTSPLKKNP
jgi:hypothetical protein